MAPDEHKQLDQHMEPDKYQQAWRAQSSQTRVTIDANLLLKVVQRNQRDFRATILRRDVIEVGVGLLLLPYWIYQGLTSSLPWTWWLGVPAIIWVVGFFLVDRMRHPQTPSEPGEPLAKTATNSLTQLEHQIWLLRNVFWWYLLPFIISSLAFFAQTAWSMWVPADEWWDTFGHVAVAVLFFAYLCVVVLGVFAFVYYLNQRAVRLQLEPRHQELLALISSLKDDTTSEVSGEYPILMSAKSVGCSPQRTVVANLSAVLLVLVVIAGIVFLSNFLSNPALSEKSPFAAVRWQSSQPEVKVGDEWFKLVSLDGIPAADIVAFSRRTYDGLWRKRFEEDLVALLTGMGHPPKDTVTLVVQALTSHETRTLEDVPMTKANRHAIRHAAQARERSEREQPTRSSVHTGDADAPLTKLVVRLRKEKDLVGLAAMVTVDGHVVASAADGQRKIGSGVWLGVGDQWHLGGISKSITATMIARLVESGRMKWSDTIGQVFREASVHEDWNPVTLRQLLTDSAGAPANFPRDVWLQLPALGPECTQARRAAVLNVIADKPACPPGRKYVYSSVGYTIAAAMAEKVTGATWEDLMKREVFEPLKLTGAGFGPPTSPDETLPQPRGHRVEGRWKVPADDDEDNTPIIGPAGTVHMTLEGLCTYTTEHLYGDLGKGKLLSAETYKLLHTPELNHYACGWVRKEPGKEIPYTVYWHNGSNTLWYALVVFIPEKKMVVAVTSNDGDIEKAEAAAWEIVKASVKQINAGVPPEVEQQQQ
jgi:CubicO group peptidase (beta-lactamase class C family)